MVCGKFINKRIIPTSLEQMYKLLASHNYNVPGGLNYVFIILRIWNAVQSATKFYWATKW
jgi:hypothetical protein